MTDSCTESVKPRSWDWYLALVAAWIPASWLVFLWTHESGHILGAWLTGGKVQKIVLHPLVFSRTDVSPNPSPMIVAWAGATLGPLIAAAAVSALILLSKHGFALYRTVLGFVLVANGCYIGLGVVQPVGDANDILELGAAPWALALYGIFAVGIGLMLWGGVRPDKQFKPCEGRMDWYSIGILLSLVLTLACVGIFCFPA